MAGSFSVEMVTIPWQAQPVGMEPLLLLLLLHLATPIMEVKVNSFSRRVIRSRSTAMTTIGRLFKPSIVVGGAAVKEAKSGDGAKDSIAVAVEEEASARVVEGERRRQEVEVDRTMDRPRPGQREKPALEPFMGTTSEAVPR